MPVWLRGFANLLDQAGISLCGNGFAYIFYISHRQHPGVIRSAAVAYAGFLLYGQRVTKSDSQTVQDCFQLFYHPGQNFLFDFIAVQEQTVNFGI